MLFTTAAFACLFLPFTLALFFVLARWHHGAAAFSLFGSSLVFYGVWMPAYVLLLVGSIVVNFWIGRQISEYISASNLSAARRWLVIGVGANLSLLAYYKYADFFVANVNLVFGTHWAFAGVMLPIGISFFTFTQIAFLADSYQKGVREYRFSHYGLFVAYFPHLVAGPVLHHAQMMPQFRDASTYRPNTANISAGLCILAMGLVKKVVLADGISPFADAIFAPTDAGFSPDAHEAWLGALAYTFQLYFDFSGYSDMAIGISLLFNIQLPLNFNSPYKAVNISEFWRRWHISLSTFLRDYLYIALGGNRHGTIRRYANLATTMLLGGLWHGASWSFVLWGALHGLYLMINQGFRALCGPRWRARLDDNWLACIASWLLTMLAVVVTWVFFRAQTLDGALRLLRAMAGQVPQQETHALLWNAGLHWTTGIGLCLGLGALACLAPNSNMLGQRALALCRSSARWRALLGGLSLGVALLMVLLNTARDSTSAFIYFNF